MAGRLLDVADREERRTAVHAVGLVDRSDSLAVRHRDHERRARGQVHPLEKTGGTLGYDAYATLRLANGMVGCLQYSGSVNHAASKSNLEVIGDSTCMLSASDNDLVTLYGESPQKTSGTSKSRAQECGDISSRTNTSSAASEKDANPTSSRRTDGARWRSHCRLVKAHSETIRIR